MQQTPLWSSSHESRIEIYYNCKIQTPSRWKLFNWLFKLFRKSFHYQISQEKIWALERHCISYIMHFGVKLSPSMADISVSVWMIGLSWTPHVNVRRRAHNKPSMTQIESIYFPMELANCSGSCSIDRPKKHISSHSLFHMTKGKEKIERLSSNARCLLLFHHRTS